MERMCVEPLRIRLRSEEHTSELQSQSNLVCRLLLEKKKNHDNYTARYPSDTVVVAEFICTTDIVPTSPTHTIPTSVYIITTYCVSYVPAHVIVYLR